MTNMTEKEERVWAYLVANRQASVDQVAEACDVEDDFVEAMMERIGSENWRENVSPFFEADIPDTDDGIVKTDDVAEGADAVQVGGSHYKDMTLQPWAVMEALLTREEFIGFLKGNIIKYSMRQGHKGADDGDKGNHYIAKLKEVMQQA